MELRGLEQITRELFPEWGDERIDLEVIEKGGSGRLFVRVTPSSGASVVAMHYTADRPDNLRFAAITDFLERQKIPAPRIVRRREEEGLLWVEDLGRHDLQALANEPWELRRPAYQAAFAAVTGMHRCHETAPPDQLPPMEAGFDEALYAWEQGYFLTHYVERFGSSAVATSLREAVALRDLREDLAAAPRALIHRDFQSTNVMLIGEDAYLIDYQGMRWGLPAYDLASMIYDPYAPFTEQEREDLITDTFALVSSSPEILDFAAFRRRLVQCATQRLMQALGAYGFLGAVKGKTEFFQHIPVARQRLILLGREPGGLAMLSEVLEGLPDNGAAQNHRPDAAPR